MQQILKAFVNPYFALYALAKKFILIYEGFSYDFEKNGEKYLLEKLGSSNIKTIFDVGANVGDWTGVALQKFPFANIHSFEISKKTFQVLNNRHRRNERVILNNFGLSCENEEIEYKDYGENSCVNSLIMDADFHDKSIKPTFVKAAVETGDSYCKRNFIGEIDILKIDVEGAEHLVLGGFSEMLEGGLIKLIQFEYGYTHGDAKFLIKDFYKLLESYGYILGPLKPTGVMFMDFEYALNDFNSGPNYVAIHKREKEMINKLKGKYIKGFPRR